MQVPLDRSGLVHPERQSRLCPGGVRKTFVFIDLDSPTMVLSSRETPGDPHDLHYVGLTLRADHGEYFVAGIATRNGTATVTGAQPGDDVPRIDGLSVRGATRQAVSNRRTGVLASGGR